MSNPIGPASSALAECGPGPGVPIALDPFPRTVARRVSANDGFAQFHDAMCAKARDLSLRKGADYASADRPSDDPLQRFKNFRMCEHVGLCSTEQGIIVRMLDKVTRIGQLLAPGKAAQVKDESIEDTLLDVINYSVLLSAYRTVTRTTTKEIA